MFKHRECVSAAVSPVAIAYCRHTYEMTLEDIYHLAEHGEYVMKKVIEIVGEMGR